MYVLLQGLLHGACQHPVNLVKVHVPSHAAWSGAPVRAFWLLQLCESTRPPGELAYV